MHFLSLPFPVADTGLVGWLGEADTVSATELSRMEEEFLLTNKIKKQKSKYFGREEEFILRKLVCRFFWLF